VAEVLAGTQCSIRSLSPSTDGYLMRVMAQSALLSNGRRARRLRAPEPRGWEGLRGRRLAMSRIEHLGGGSVALVAPSGEAGHTASLWLHGNRGGERQAADVPLGGDARLVPQVWSCRRSAMLRGG
jgi:hypothetical protein